jgi:hypothetical protein
MVWLGVQFSGPTLRHRATAYLCRFLRRLVPESKYVVVLSQWV